MVASWGLLNELHRTEGQAELIGGRTVRLPLHVFGVAQVLNHLFDSLDRHVRATGDGIVGTSTLGYVVPLLPSGRESFCADASYYGGPLPSNPMGFIEGTPDFAIEVREPGASGADAEHERSAKRADYFAAGTLVVWDVDPKAELIHVYRRDDPDHPTTYARGEVAEAEPAVPGWRIEVEAVFGPRPA